MSHRHLIDGRVVAEAEESVKMTIDSKCPEKWLFVDLETGQVWQRKENDRNDFVVANQDNLKTLISLADNIQQDFDA